MNRQDLIEFSNQQGRLARRIPVFVAIFLVWTAGVFTVARSMEPELAAVVVFPSILVPTIVFAGLALRTQLGAPRCPHCGTRLVWALLPIAISSGKCGRCGRSIESS